LAATPTAVKSAYDLAALALPKAGGTVTGDITLGTNIGIQFEGTTDDANEIRLIGADATADRTITLPNVTGTVITTGDSGTVTSAMIANDSIVDADINASAAIVDTKLATIATAGKVSNSATTAASANTASTIVARDASGNFTAGTITANLTGTASNVTTNANLTGDVTSVGNATSIAAGVIVNADINASAAIAGTKVSPDFGSQIIATTGSLELGHATDTTLSRSAAGVLAVEGVVVPTISSTNTFTNKTLTDPAIIGTIIEDVFTISDGAAFEVDPGNGSIQLITLGANRTPKATNFAAGESITLMVDDGTAYTLTWTDATWGSGGVVWVGGSAPTLATSGYTVIQFWKVSTQVYGAFVGNVA
jgi:hypothetical protein